MNSAINLNSFGQRIIRQIDALDNRSARSQRQKAMEIKLMHESWLMGISNVRQRMIDHIFLLTGIKYARRKTENRIGLTKHN